MVSKSWENFMFWIISYLRKVNKYKRHFFLNHHLYQDCTNFYVYHRPYNKPNDMCNKLSLMLDSFKKIKVLLAFSCFPKYSDSVRLPGFPLFHLINKYLYSYEFITNENILCFFNNLQQLITLFVFFQKHMELYSLIYLA